VAASVGSMVGLLVGTPVGCLKQFNDVTTESGN
jgi:hypothetical protein